MDTFAAIFLPIPQGHTADAHALPTANCGAFIFSKFLVTDRTCYLINPNPVDITGLPYQRVHASQCFLGVPNDPHTTNK